MVFAAKRAPERVKNLGGASSSGLECGLLGSADKMSLNGPSVIQVCLLPVVAA